MTEIEKLTLKPYLLALTATEKNKRPFSHNGQSIIENINLPNFIVTIQALRQYKSILKDLERKKENEWIDKVLFIELLFADSLILNFSLGKKLRNIFEKEMKNEDDKWNWKDHNRYKFTILPPISNTQFDIVRSSDDKEWFIRLYWLSIYDNYYWDYYISKIENDENHVEDLIRDTDGLIEFLQDPENIYHETYKF